MHSHSAIARRTVDAWLAQLQPDDPAFALDAYGQCLFDRGGGDRCVVFLPDDDSPTLHFYADIRHLAQPLRPALCESLLALNLLGAETRGGMLAFDARERMLVLSYTWEPGDADVARFCTILENFLDTAAHIRNRVDALFLEHAGSRPPSSFRRQQGKTP